MIAKREVWKYNDAVRIWVGKYRDSHNLLHWHYDCELIYVEQGGIDVFCERRRHSLSVGQALFINSGQVHHMQASVPGTVLVVIIFDFNIIKSFANGFKLPSPKLSGSYPVPAVYSELRKILTEKQPFYGAEAACTTVRLMVDIFRREGAVPREQEDKTARSFIRLLEDIGEKYEYYTFEDAAAFMGMSPAYFSRYFHGITGITFSQHLNYVRTDNAVQLMHAEPHLSYTDIAEKCGFGTIRSFNRIFKELTGFSPSRLPNDFSLGESFYYHSTKSFNPTLVGCELIETSEN